MDQQRIYLDNAATSWPKPPAVYEAVLAYLRDHGAPAGRGAYARALEAGAIVQRARRGVAGLLRAESPETIAFGFNGTDVLNLAIHGLLSDAGHAVATAAEHNSVLRPLHAWQQRTGGRLSIVPCDPTGTVDLEALERVLEAGADLLALTHASNVSGAIQPVEQAARLARRIGAVVLLDAAQTLGHEPVEVDRLPVDLVASSGHKGLLGPLGTGILYVRPGLEHRLQTLRQGGTGTRSEQPSHPEQMPEKLEAGNPNLPGLAGLAAAVEWLIEQGPALAASQRELTDLFWNALSKQNGVRLYGTRDPDRRIGVVSFTIDGYAPQEVSALLDSHYGIEVRSGLHCAPLVHQALGTAEAGGTVRAGIGPFNTPEQVQRAIEAIGEIAAEAVGS